MTLGEKNARMKNNEDRGRRWCLWANKGTQGKTEESEKNKEVKGLAFLLIMAVLLIGTTVPGCDGEGGGPAYTPPPRPSPAAFSVSNLSIQPAEVGANEAVTISVSVANTGGSQGSCYVVLNINEVEEEVKSVTIAAGTSKSVSFSVTREDTGKYNVIVLGLIDLTIGEIDELDGLFGSFTVLPLK